MTGKGSIRVVVSVMALAITIFTCFEAFAAAKSPPDEAILMVGLPVEKPATGMKTIQAQALVAAPPAFVWQRLTDYGDISNMLPGYEKTTLTQQGGTKLLDIDQKVSRLLPAYHYRVRLEENPAQRQLRLNRVSGDFKFLEATYKLVPRNGGKETLVMYELNIITGKNLPGSGAVIRDNTRDTLSAMRKYVEAAYQKSMIGKN